MIAALFAILFGLVCQAFASGAGIDGKWKFEKTVIYGGGNSLDDSPPFTEFLIDDGKLILSKSCSVGYVQEDYYFSEVFQGLSKEGLSQAPLDRLVRKNFGFSLATNKKAYLLSAPVRKCARPAVYFFYTGERVIFAVGEIFYSYTKAAGNPLIVTSPQVTEASHLLKNYKKTPFPIDFYRYFSTCRPKILAGKSRPHTTDKCAPEYYPYVADPESKDMLMQIIGNHDYIKGGAETGYGFSPPFQEKTAATFLVFEPVRQVILVRVDDFEVVRNEERNIMTGVYLSIVDGKVVDQISGCAFDATYTCLENGRPVARLTKNGKFLRLY